MKNVFITMVSILLAPLFAHAQDDNIFSYTLGDYTVWLLSEGQSMNDPGILIGAPGELVDKYIPTGKYPSAVNAFLVRTPEKWILFDAGFGRNLFDNIAAAGCSPREMDAVYLTHMHGDHIGGMLRDGSPAFPGAELLVSRAESDYWTSDRESAAFKSAQEVISKYSASARLVEPLDIRQVPSTDGIYPVKAYGHTPGHTCYMLVSKGERLLVWGDLTHVTPVQMPHPEIAVTYDVEPDKAIESRLDIMEYVARHDIPVAGMHIAWPGIGRIRADGNGGYEFIPAR